MEFPQFSYDTYQGVRHNLSLYTAVVISLSTLFVYFLVLPRPIADSIDSTLTLISSSPWLKGVSSLAALSVIAFLLVEIIQIHDRWYDHYIICWRYRYDLDFIIPRLIHPFASHIDPNFYQVADRHRSEFLSDLFYEFVTDRDTKIKKNTLVRFYEAITKYWMTQINELVLIVLLIVVFVFKFEGPHTLAYIEVLLNSTLILLCLFLLNRLCISATRERVRSATLAEVNEIVRDHRAALKSQLQALCQRHTISFRDA